MLLPGNFLQNVQFLLGNCPQVRKQKDFYRANTEARGLMLSYKRALVTHKHSINCLYK